MLDKNTIVSTDYCPGYLRAVVSIPTVASYGKDGTNYRVISWYVDTASSQTEACCELCYVPCLSFPGCISWHFDSVKPGSTTCMPSFVDTNAVTSSDTSTRPNANLKQPFVVSNDGKPDLSIKGWPVPCDPGTPSAQISIPAQIRTRASVEY
jgi:hypothetical protein